MTGRRGLTLIEVLAAALLLSLLAAACLPLMREAAIAAQHAPTEIDLLDLSALAETVLTDSEAGDKGPVPVADELVLLQWPDQPDREPVHVRTLGAVDAGVDHAWMVFEVGGMAISRCVAVAPSSVAERSP